MKYVALLRGIGPSNPNMRNEKLRDLFEDLGFSNVQTLISSGNVLFESKITSQSALEDKIEKALPLKLGFKSTTIIRSEKQLLDLVSKKPFGKLMEGPKSRLNVTFLKHIQTPKLKFPLKGKNGGFVLLGYFDGAICSSTDLSVSGSPETMNFLEKEFDKKVTTRTWLTVNRIIKKMETTNGE